MLKTSVKILLRIPGISIENVTKDIRSIGISTALRMSGRLVSAAMRLSVVSATVMLKQIFLLFT